MKKKLGAAFLVAVLPACTFNGGGDCSVDVALDGGGGGDGGAGGTAEAGQAIRIGFGADGVSCDASGSFAVRASSEDAPDIAAKTILVPVGGEVVAASFVVPYETASGESVCAPTAHTFLVTEPSPLPVPKLALVHEKLSFSADDVLSAPPYAQGGVDLAKLVVLRRELAAPLRAEAGDYVHLGALLDDPGACVAACTHLPDGTPVSLDDVYCSMPTWEGCASAEHPGVFDVAFVAWIDFVPDP